MEDCSSDDNGRAPLYIGEVMFLNGSYQWRSSTKDVMINDHSVLTVLLCAAGLLSYCRVQQTDSNAG